ncbi:MAG: ABC transporter ATP-binding protein [Clostridia bacterium]|nr:ABC transporter ATP-binding protein [Clostridia bacterium]
MTIKQSLLHFRLNRTEEFEAVKGISFSVEKGRILGIIGKNGSGKSTLLRALAGIFSPDRGTIDLMGNTVSLMSIGTGFQNKLTGFENIILAGLLMGFTEEEIRKKAPEIIEFSELGNFIYKPVRTYSSGMYSKLAFSITALLETDIMLIDEVLSVGDIHFREKSGQKMREIIRDENRTVVIVSHSMGTLKELCNEILWLNDGVIMETGEPDEVIAHYEAYMKKL